MEVAIVFSFLILMYGRVKWLLKQEKMLILSVVCYCSISARGRGSYFD